MDINLDNFQLPIPMFKFTQNRGDNQLNAQRFTSNLVHSQIIDEQLYGGASTNPDQKSKPNEVQQIAT